MKTTLITFMIATTVFMSVSCRESNENRSAEGASRSDGMRKIYVALTSYENEHGQFPNSLSDLVSERALKTEELLIARLDGSLQRPEYFPKAQRVADSLLAFDPGCGTGRIIILVDGSVRTEVNSNKTEDKGP